MISKYPLLTYTQYHSNLSMSIDHGDKFIPKTRKELLMEIDKKFQDVFELIADYIEFKTNEANIEGGAAFGVEDEDNNKDDNNKDDNNKDDESGEIEVESDEDGDYLDGEGNIYNVETSEIIGKKIIIRKKEIKTFKDDKNDKHFIDKDGNIYDIESSPPKVIGKKDLKTGEKHIKITEHKVDDKVDDKVKVNPNSPIISKNDSVDENLNKTSKTAKATATKATKTPKAKANTTKKAKKDEIKIIN